MKMLDYKSCCASYSNQTTVSDLEKLNSGQHSYFIATVTERARMQKATTSTGPPDLDSAQYTANLWDQVWAKVNHLVGGGSKVQLAYPFIDWTWPVPKPGYIDATAYSIVGQVPKWSAVGKYAPSDKDLYDTYFTIIQTCPKLTLTPHQQQQLKHVEDQINDAQAKRTANEKAMEYAWEQAKDVPEGIPPPTYSEWMVDSGWEQILDADKLAVQKATKTKANIVAQQNPRYDDAINDATMPTGKFDQKGGFLKCDVSGYPQWRAGFLVDEGRDWIATLTEGGGQPLNIHMEASKSSHSVKESWAGGASDLGSCFFGIFKNGSWHDMNLTESDSKVEVDIEIQAVTQVPVRPDAWYHGGYLSQLAKLNQWNHPYTTKGGESPVFGKGGMLPLMITGLIAGYQISFKVSMSSSTFERHVSDFKASGGIRIGPFHIGGGYTTHSDTWEKKADGSSFSGTSKAEYPFILGFTVAEPGIGE